MKKNSKPSNANKQHLSDPPDDWGCWLSTYLNKHCKAERSIRYAVFSFTTTSSMLRSRSQDETYPGLFSPPPPPYFLHYDEQTSYNVYIICQEEKYLWKDSETVSLRPFPLSPNCRKYPIDEEGIPFEDGCSEETDRWVRWEKGKGEEGRRHA